MIKSKKHTVAAVVKMYIPAAKATPAPPVGSQLGKYGISLMNFCKEFNEKTSHIEHMAPVPTVVTIYANRTYEFVIKSLPCSYLIKQYAIKHDKKLLLSLNELETIWKLKSADFTAYTKQKAFRSIAGTAKSMKIALSDDATNAIYS